MSDQAKDECEGCQKLKVKVERMEMKVDDLEDELSDTKESLETAEDRVRELEEGMVIKHKAIMAAWEQIAVAVDPNPLTSPAEIAAAVVAAFRYRKAV